MPRFISKFLKRSRKRAIRIGLLAGNVLLVAVVVVFIRQNSGAHTVKSSVAAAGANTQAINPLDTLSSADIAVSVARMTNLPETTSVANHADSVSAQLTAAVSSSQEIAKPQILSTKIRTKEDVQEYQVPDGQNLGDVANKFGVTSESIKWSNNLTNVSSSSNMSGKKLLIPPVNGFVYTVKSSDSVESLATKYGTSKEQIIAFNDAEITGIKDGMRIVIPGGTIQAPTYVAPAYLSGFAWGSGAIYGANGYDYGWCTWWAAKRRADIGRPVPANLGDAYTWVSRARLAGLSVSGSPAQGAVIWSNTSYPGHVGFVESVEEDGSIWVSDMNSHGQVSKTNSAPAGGWNRVSWKHVSTNQFGAYRFIN